MELPDPQDAIGINPDVSEMDQVHAIGLEKLREAVGGDWLLLVGDELDGEPICRVWSTASPEFLLLALGTLRYAIFNASVKAWTVLGSEPEEAAS